MEPRAQMSAKSGKKNFFNYHPMLRTKNFLLLVFLSHFLSFSSVFSQVEPPNYKLLFREDSKNYKSALKEQKNQILVKDRPSNSQGTFFNAPKIEFLQDKNEYVGDGGVVISYGEVQIQGENGRFNTITKQGQLKGDLIFSSPEGQLTASGGWFNLEKETGEFYDANFILETDGYHVKGKSIEKISAQEYQIEDAEMTTCDCIDGAKPWSLASDNIDITQEGYAKARPFFLKCNDVPVFYLPYFIFPAKINRHSGLLIPQIGYSSKNGFQYSQPIFWNANETTDVIFTPFTETNSRTGIKTQFTELFSRRSNIDTKLIFSDESPRDGDLQGTQTGDLFDPTFDEKRVGGYYKQRWRAAPGELPLSFVADGKYVSDDLFLREIEEDRIGLAQDRFITSRASLRSPIGDYFNAQLGTEYTQTFVSDGDLQFQRLPELALDGYRSMRIFGQNPYGFKLVSTGNFTATEFARKEGYDGNRFDLNPKFKIPFYYKNIFNGDINFGARQTWYALSNTTDPNSAAEIEDSTDRSIYDFGLKLSTALEKVFDVDSDGWLASLSNVGARNQFDKLLRVKHTIEPFLQYGYVPEVDQEASPLFDSTDRIREQSLISYGVSTRFIGRFADDSRKKGTIAELTPEQEFISNPDPENNPELFDSLFVDETSTIRRIRGEKKELAYFGVNQTYDKKLENTDQRPYSDVALGASFYPNSYFGLGFSSNYDYEEGTFSSWGLGTKIEDDRGDHLRTRISYIDNAVSQIDGNLEIALTDHLKIGYYGQYDDQEGDFLENRLALRILSKCDCWKLDLGYRERINPDDKSYTILLTLKGLGDIGD